VLKFEFLITIQVLVELFSITLPLSKQLQNQNLEYFQSLQMVNTILEKFENKRKNNIQSFNSIYTKSLTSADMHKIEVKKRVQNKLIAKIYIPKTQKNISV
jgi:hypothetical protein